jgi:hypothetical protein
MTVYDVRRGLITSSMMHGSPSLEVPGLSVAMEAADQHSSMLLH